MLLSCYVTESPIETWWSQESRQLLCFDLQEGPHRTGYIICHYIQGLEYRPGEDFGDLLSNKVEMVERAEKARKRIKKSFVECFPSSSFY